MKLTHAFLRSAAIDVSMVLDEWSKGARNVGATCDAQRMLIDFFTGLDPEGWGNIIQGALLIVTVFGLGTALRNGRKDRESAARIAAADRFAAEERGTEDRRDADKRAEADRAHARQQAQQQFRMQQALRLVQLVHAGRPPSPSAQIPWTIEIRGLLYALGQDSLPITWKLFTGSAPDLSQANIAPSVTSESRTETSQLAQQAGRELHCHSCFHNH